MFKKVFVAFDGSESARKALVEAYRLVLESDAKLTVLSVSDDPNITVPADLAALGLPADTYSLDYDKLRVERDAAVEKAQESVMNEIRGLVGDPDVPVSVEILSVHASVADAILDYSIDNGCDLMIMGSRGLGRFRGALGSVSYAVLRSAPFPVLVVK